MLAAPALGSVAHEPIEFMKFWRQYYAHRLNEPFGEFGIVLTVESNVEMVEVDLDSDSHSD